jgi:hypothetical protein
MRTPATIPILRAPREHCSTRPRGRAAMSRQVTVDLTPQTVEQIARRVTELLRRTEEQRTPALLSAGELARHLRVQRPWVYKHRHLLGGQRIGDGPKAPWRFDLETATQALERGTTIPT